jgi:4-hydroxy-3-polyprenylbenzoate decarboxylase
VSRRIVVGVSGASGAPYARRLLLALKERPGLELAVVLSENARAIWELECGTRPEDLGVAIHPPTDWRAPFASGSALWHAMVIVPCSMGVVGRIAAGTSDSLLERAADVMLKERRTLIIVPRETPMSSIHLEALAKLAHAGAVVLPASPSFYGVPRTIEDVLDTIVARILDHLGIEHDIGQRWGNRP